MSGNSKILITGSKGLLGNYLTNNISADTVRGYSRKELDITNEVKLEKCLFEESPNVVIHTAAFTDVDECEKYPIKAFRVNSLPLEIITDYCKKKNALLVYISSTGVYGEKKQHEPYDERDKPGPTTVHHMSKLLCEVLVKKLEVLNY